MPRRKICVVTGSRADYGLLYWLMREIQSDPDLHLQLVATGMHLSPEFGNTYEVIEADGFHIDEKVEMLLSSDTPVGMAKSVGLGVIGFADAFARLLPDIVVLLGDRFEALAAAQAALMCRIPIAHIHGGESSEGAVDEAIRHSITKMAHLHFVSAEPYRQRVIQLGEDPARVFLVGAPGLDHVYRQRLLSRDELEQALGWRLGSPTFLVTYHPVTLGDEDPVAAVSALIAALERFPEARILITKPNADAGGRAIIRQLEAYASQAGDRVRLTVSLGQVRYLSAIRHCDVVVGNSSSGLIEAPAFQKPTVNIGIRQAGRLRAPSVIDCEPDPDAIAAAISQALCPTFRSRLADVKSPYGDGAASPRIKERLKSEPLDGLLVKRFYDYPG